MKTVISVSIPAMALFVAGAWNAHRSHTPVTISHTVSPTNVQAPAAETSSPKMWAKKATFYKGDSFDLYFTAPNAPFLGVVDPSGHFFYVVFPSEAAVGKLKPLVDSERFASLHKLKIRTASLKADPYTHGVYTNQRVFTQSGTYTFLLGENLHIDDPELLTRVAIHYVHAKRRDAAPTDVAMNVP